MNWRNTSKGQDHFYDHPATQLFPNFTEWFGFLKGKGLKTYFNDHPYPVGPQTSPEEIAFRWAGLSKWMDEGLDFWWFDRNWQFSIPPPFAKAALPYEGGDWQGLRNAPWGSHVYHTSVAEYYHRHPPRRASAPSRSRRWRRTVTRHSPTLTWAAATMRSPASTSTPCGGRVTTCRWSTPSARWSTRASRASSPSCTPTAGATTAASRATTW